MRVTTAFNRILGLTGAVVESVEFSVDGVVVGIRARARRLTCPCGRSTRARYDTSRRRWRHLDMGATKVWLEADIARVDCRRCGRYSTDSIRTRRRSPHVQPRLHPPPCLRLQGNDHDRARDIASRHGAH